MRPLAMLAVMAALFSGCQSLSYQPKATVGLAPSRIPLQIEMRDLGDTSPADDRTRALGGTAATASDTLAGELAPSVTDAIIDNFILDEVFLDISRRPEKPELVMSGTIRRFYGKAYLNALGYAVTLDPFGVAVWLAYLGLPIYSSSGGVDLELRFETADGQPVAQYSAAKEFNKWSSMYRQPLYGIGTEVNRTFSEVLADLRSQMLADRNKLMQAAGSGDALPVSEPEPEHTP